MPAAATLTGLEPLVITHLRERLPDAVHVTPARDLAGVVENRQKTPAVQIYPRGYRVLETQPAGALARFEVTFVAVVVVRTPKAQLDGAAAWDDVGPLADQVLALLMGWRPGNGYGHLEAANAPPPQWTPGGFGYFPLAFTSTLTVRGEQQRTGA